MQKASQICAVTTEAMVLTAAAELPFLGDQFLGLPSLAM